jgi:1-acyl-sn-glycerol-3-phosphate acyltransferase
MIITRSIIFNLLFYSWTLIVAAIGSPLLLLPKTKFWTPRAWCYIGKLLLKYVVGIDYEIRGKENIKQQNVIYACRHQSAWETMIFYDIIDYPAFILKRELLLIPFFNLYLFFLKMIAINRSAGSRSLRDMLKQIAERLREQRAIVLFPEGTRKNFTDSIHLQSGISAIYKHKMAPIVPVVLNSGLFWSKNSFVKCPGKIIIEFLPAIADDLDKKDFKQQLANILYEKTQELKNG